MKCTSFKPYFKLHLIVYIKVCLFIFALGDTKRAYANWIIWILLRHRKHFGTPIYRGFTIIIFVTTPPIRPRLEKLKIVSLLQAYFETRGCEYGPPPYFRKNIRATKTVNGIVFLRISLKFVQFSAFLSGAFCLQKYCNSAPNSSSIGLVKHESYTFGGTINFRVR